GDLHDLVVDAAAYFHDVAGASCRRAFGDGAEGSGQAAGGRVIARRGDVKRSSVQVRCGGERRSDDQGFLHGSVGGAAVPGGSVGDGNADDVALRRVVGECVHRHDVVGVRAGRQVLVGVLGDG